jgi:hypothetical protein
MAAQHAVNPGQLKMFMTPKEIHKHYQPLDADREDVETEDNSNPHSWGLRSETDSELWERKSSEAAMSPRDYHYAREGESPERSLFNVDSLMGHSSYPSPNTSDVDSRGFVTTSGWEEHEHREHSYLERKAQEKSDARYEKWNGPSIWDSVRTGGVQQPVHLGQQFGEQGKPQIVGGHHRIAAATDTRPNDLIPVLHHESIDAAKSTLRPGSPGFKYT